MNKISLLITFTLGIAGLQACTSSKSKLAECTAATSTDWNSQSGDTSTPVEGYGAVHETYIKLERRGQSMIDSSVCAMSRIYCPKPYGDMGCQVFTCDYLEPAAAIYKSTDYQGTKYYNVPVAGRVLWDGCTLRCQNL